MRHDNISISLPPGYVQVLDQESSRYNFNRSEFIRVMFDAYLTAVVDQIREGKRKGNIDPKTGLADFFPEIFPHKKQEAHDWLHGYLRLVIRIYKEREEHKTKTGSVGVDDIYGNVSKEDLYEKQNESKKVELMWGHFSIPAHLLS